jgi:hypothetical protein
MPGGYRRSRIVCPQNIAAQIRGKGSQLGGCRQGNQIQHLRTILQRLPAVPVAVIVGNWAAAKACVMNVWSASMNYVPSLNATTPRM